ncbi:MAG: ThuA domain-containing protein [Candidatus Nealsonbacteria bacterium]|nr:ThuA domain-containing protein [Candidatus Nealsonbacteria bacterium]
MICKNLVWSVLSASIAIASAASTASAADALSLQTRSRAPVDGADGQFKIVYKTVHWAPEKTAIIVCDMWARHWCDGACDRGSQLAPRMNRFVTEARKRGVLIVHAPSSGMKHYADHPARKRATDAPKAGNVPKGMGGWAGLLPHEKKEDWPIDQSDGGCDDQPKCPSRPMDVHQTAAIEILDEDAISDSGVECWNLFEQRGIDNVILLGVHTNMCVIGRPFGLRSMVRVGKNVLLVRDLTDTMYNSRSEPQVSHVRGTELIVEYIEKHVCPTIASTALLPGPAVRFKEDRRPHVAMIVSDDHYDADKTLPAFAQMLRERYGLHCTVHHGEGKSDFPAMDDLPDADVMVLFIRRLALPEKQLATVRKYLDSGKPLVGLRTASHAFDVKGNAPEGCAEWRDFDPQVLGGSYHGHGSNTTGTDVALVRGPGGHPIIDGIEPAKWHSKGSLYFAAPIDKAATLLMNGTSDGKTEPLTWTRSYKNARVFYSSLGHPDDFGQKPFRTMLVNALFWAMDRPVPEVN